MSKRIFRGLTASLVLLLMVACSGDNSRPADARNGVAGETATPKRTDQPRGLSVARARNGRGGDDEGRLPEAGIYLGTGVFANATRATAESAEVTAEGEITLNFVNAEIRDVIKTVLGDVLKVNYTVEPSIQGVTTIQTQRPLERSAVIPALETALRLSGVALVKAGDIYRVVPIAQAARQGQILDPPFRRERAGGFAIEIVPLRYVSAVEMQRLLEPLVPQGSILRVDQARNLLVLAGTDTELTAMLENIRTFDVNWIKGMSFGLFPLKYVNAKTLIVELTEVLGSQSSPLAGLVRLVPITRMNAILAISSQPEYLAQIQIWVDRLDRSNPSIDQRLYVYYVQNGRAADLAAALNTIFTGEKPADAASSVDSGQPLRLRDVALTGPNGPAVPGIVGALEPRPGPGVRPPPNIVESPRPGTDGTTQSPGGPDDGIRMKPGTSLKITASEVNNALLVMATPQEYAIIEDALTKLDITPLQVLIEASIAEVTLTSELRYGLQYFFKTHGLEIVRTDVASAAIAPFFPGFSMLFSSNADIRVILNLLEDVTDVNVISAPQLMVLNNQTASLQVGDQVPIATQSAVSITDPGAPIVNTIQFRDTGVILKVTPRVNESGLVLLDIAQEVSDVARTTSSTIDSPTIQQRKINSSVAVKDGQTIALGGLIRDGTDKGKSGIPVLQNIPYLGVLFGSRSENIRRTELLVLITPRVVRDSRAAAEVTNELRNRMRAVIPLRDRTQ